MKNKGIRKKWFSAITEMYGKEFYKLLYCVSSIYGVDVDLIIKDCGPDGSNQFWELLDKYYKDYGGHGDGCIS